jgi:hypothetical protein
MLTPLKALVNEFYQSDYKPREKMEKVRDKEIMVDAQLFDEVLKLPLLKLMVSKSIVLLHKLISRLA